MTAAIRWCYLLHVVLIGPGDGADADEAWAVQRIVGWESIDAMPADIGLLFRAHRATFERGISEPGEGWTRERTMRERACWHELGADLTAVEQSHEARVEACRSFPRDEIEARRLYQTRAYAKGGRLPWAIDECYRLLVEAFKGGEVEEVVLRAGHLVHFVSDGANPFRVSVNGDGSATGNVIIGSGRGVHARSIYRSVRQRFEMGLMGRYAEAYGEAIVLSPADYQPVWEPVPATFEFAEDSLRVLDRVAKADRETITRLEIVDRKSFAAQEDAYFSAMDASCREVCVDRLRAASLLAANLIGGAWQTAGSPIAESIGLRGSRETVTRPSADVDMTAALLGSRHSNVFHRRDCQFAKRISLDNVVTFASALEARQSGRRACKACQP